jgi:hypothetical protein
MRYALGRLGGRGWGRWAGLIAVVTLLLAGCNPQRQPVYQDQRGFRFTPPPGWVERARGDAMPARSGHRRQDVPLPPLGVPGTLQERLLVRYDRLTAGRHAWLRVTVADVPSATPLEVCLSDRSPGREWERASEVESLEVSGRPAARIAFVGRWGSQEYVCETAAVRQGGQVYLMTASFPASDGTARGQVRQAVAGATWQQSSPAE